MNVHIRFVYKPICYQYMEKDCILKRKTSFLSLCSRVSFNRGRGGKRNENMKNHVLEFHLTEREGRESTQHDKDHKCLEERNQ
ncbi:hypothetical protein HanHA300_Chr13g0483201 [Helianthus annuus]|nr:hypothetical protein HanHA300_Chr13g0483201 [Helianthus annuus]KAJ0497786.1 hypothetical protein HanHA89_Chr13g0515101 [Helianthus annuus]